jgi:hypothetical protein
MLLPESQFHCLASLLDANLAAISAFRSVRPCGLGNRSGGEFSAMGLAPMISRLDVRRGTKSVCPVSINRRQSRWAAGKDAGARAFSPRSAERFGAGSRQLHQARKRRRGPSTIGEPFIRGPGQLRLAYLENDIRNRSLGTARGGFA